MKFYVMGTQPSCSKAVALTGRVFDDLPSALHYRDTVSPAWHAFVVVQITNEVQHGSSAMKLDEIQNALFAAYDLRNAMTTEEKYQPTENDTYGESLALITQTLENLEAEMEKEVEETEHYSKIFDTNHGELSNPSTTQD